VACACGGNVPNTTDVIARFHSNKDTDGWPIENAPITSCCYLSRSYTVLERNCQQRLCLVYEAEQQPWNWCSCAVHVRQPINSNLKPG
jgi:hypothetical protein